MMPYIRNHAWKWWVLLALCVQTGGITVEAAQSSHSATTVINEFHATLLSTMRQAKSMGYKGRYTHLEPAIRQSYDFPRVVRITAGKYWSDLNQAQKLQFIRIFSRLVIATYAHRFNGYSGELFQTISTKTSRRGRMLVRTVLIKKDRSQVHLDYLLQQNKGQWRIINVVAQGVSDLALKRADYTRVLRMHGFDTLMTKLKDKITQYSQ